MCVKSSIYMQVDANAFLHTGVQFLYMHLYAQEVPIHGITCTCSS